MPYPKLIVRIFNYISKPPAGWSNNFRHLLSTIDNYDIVGVCFHLLLDYFCGIYKLTDIMDDNKIPTFSSPKEEIEYWRNLSEKYKEK